MTNILDKSVISRVTPVDALFIAGASFASEEILRRTPVGDGTLMSGAVKGAMGMLLSSATNNKWVNYASAGLVQDGAQDIMFFLRRFAQAKTQTETASNGGVVTL